MENINRCLNTISEYTRAKTDGSLEQKTKADKRESKARTHEAIIEIREILNHHNNTLTPDILERIEVTAMNYADTVRVSDSRVSSAFRSLFSIAAKREEALEIHEQASRQLGADQHTYAALIQASAERLEGLINENPAIAKQEARELLIVIAKGEAEVLRRPISRTVEDLVNAIGDRNPNLVHLLRSEDLFSTFERKTGILQAAANPNIAEALTTKIETTEDQTIAPAPNLDETVAALREQRLFRLQNLRDVYKATKNNPDETVNTKYFPETKGWYVGARRHQETAAFETEMRAIGTEFNIPVISDSTNPIFVGQEMSLTFNDDQRAAYTQDFIDFSKSEIRVPLHPDGDKYAGINDDTIRATRIARNNDLWTTSSLTNELGEQFIIRPPTQEIGVVGQVWEERQSLKGINLASALGVQPVMNLTFSEGGNTLIGQKPDGSPFVIIGQDSYDMSKALMERDLGRAMTDREVRMAFAIDYGVKASDLHFVEQPGGFHLDMSMAIIGSNTVVVNDAVLAAVDYEADLEEWMREQGITNPEAIAQEKRTLHNRAIATKRFEDKTAQDLEAQGFNVVRVGGCFYNKRPHAPPIPVMNFFNFVSATTPDETKLVVAMGVTKESYKVKFSQMMAMGEVEAPEIRFLNSESTISSLQQHGGISCRTKTI